MNEICLHNYPCNTSLCPKIQHPEKYPYGICHVHYCSAVNEYARLTVGNNYCPKCGSKLVK